MSAFIVIVIAMSIIIGADSVKPRYRGSELTIAQFADNYNHTLAILTENHDITDKLKPDGTKYPQSEQTVIINLNGTSTNEDDNFTYQTKNGYLYTITYENSWNDVFYLQPVQQECYITAMSIVLAQKDWRYSDIQKFAELWDSELSDVNAQFSYKNVTVRWEIEQSNCVYQNGTLIGNTDHGKCSASVSFTLTIDY